MSSTEPPAAGGHAPHAPPPHFQPHPGTNGFAIAALILGIVAWPIGSILALIFGHMAKKQIDATGGLQGGRGMAIAGIVLGWIGVAALIALIIVFLAVGVSGGFDDATEAHLVPAPSSAVLER